MSNRYASRLAALRLKNSKKRMAVARSTGADTWSQCGPIDTDLLISASVGTIFGVKFSEEFRKCPEPARWQFGSRLQGFPESHQYDRFRQMLSCMHCVDLVKTARLSVTTAGSSALQPLLDAINALALVAETVTQTLLQVHDNNNNNAACLSAELHF